MAKMFKIQGRVRDPAQGKGLEGLWVKAYDRDGFFDDLLGSAYTGPDGSFEILCESDDFRDFFEQRPDVYLHIYTPGDEHSLPRRVYTSAEPMTWSGSRLKACEVEIPEEKVHPRRPISRCRDIYLKIEKLPAYSPVAPDDAEHDRYRRDCMRNPGHEDTRIPENEVDRRRLDALVYREYLDPAYTILKTDPLVPADINEPRADRRIPGTLIYATPGERLFIHVCNGDDQPHSLHVHGLVYGVDSDGAWPFGVQDANGRRSDAICPGQTWCYVFDVTEETIGAWPFHDHHMHISEAVDRGLFGGIVVRDPRAPKPDYEVPLFFHRLVPARGDAAFDSGTLTNGGSFSHVFATEGTYNYQCRFHPMNGVVRVTATGPASASVTILDGPGRFDPNDVTVRAGGTVTWTHAGNEPHTVTDSGGAALESFAVNGRSFVGNTPTIVAQSGKHVRWYVFNLDLSAGWHNFHVHGQRWRVGGEVIDTRSLGPAESFVADTRVPPVILPPLKGDCHDHKSHRRDEDCGCGQRVGLKRVLQPMRVTAAAHLAAPHGGAAATASPLPPTHGHSAVAQPEPPRHSKNKPGERRCVQLQGDFPIHCHVEMHMMQGMVAVLRAVQDIELTPEIEATLGFLPPLAGKDPCPDVPVQPCMRRGDGIWERLADPPIFIVHAALLHTGKVLLWSGSAEAGYPLVSLVWDPSNPADMSHTQSYGQDLFCSGHAFLSDGRLLAAGGYVAGTFNHSRAAFVFDPVSESWTQVRDMNTVRWYPTLLTLADGRIFAASGAGATEQEIYDPGADQWQTVAGAGREFPELYPSLNLLPSGEIFYSRAGWAQPDMALTQTAYLALTGPLSGVWTDLGQQQFHDRQEGMAVMQIDATVSPPATRLFVFGGGVSGPAAARNPQSLETIDLTALGGAAWSRGADMAFPRTNVNAVLLPDGTILVIGGQRNGKWNPAPGHVLEAEIYDPATDRWTTTGPMQFPRQYHSIAVLLPDGRVLTAGGVNPEPGVPERDQRNMELFTPAYLLMGPRPTVTAAPDTVAYGTSFAIDTPDAAQIDRVVLLRPASVTHHTDGGARYIKIPITGRTASQLTVTAPANGNIAPPGYYLLFIVDGNGIPSVGCFVRIS